MNSITVEVPLFHVDLIKSLYEKKLISNSLLNSNSKLQAICSNMIGGGNNNNNNNVSDVSTLNMTSANHSYSNLINKLHKTQNISGGRHSVDSEYETQVVHGSRKKKTSYMSLENSSNGKSSTLSSNSDNNAFASYATDLGRLIDNQKHEIYERVVAKISELMKVPNETARFYKTTLINLAKRTNPDLVGIDLATEVEKLATLANLKKIDIKSETEKILKWREAHPRPNFSPKQHSESQSTQSSSSNPPTKNKRQDVSSANSSSDDEFSGLSSSSA